MAKAEINLGESGSNNITDYYLQLASGVMYLVSKGEVLYNSTSAAFYLAVNYSDDYITLSKVANTYSLSITYNKTCEETIVTNNGTVTTTSKNAGDTSTIDFSTKAFFAVF